MEDGHRSLKGYLALGAALVFCPCHLPVTLAVLAGTAVGAGAREQDGVGRSCYNVSASTNMYALLSRTGRASARARALWTVDRSLICSVPCRFGRW